MKATVVQDKKKLLLLTKANKRQITSLGVKKLGLFGSFVRNEQKKDSDVDLLVEFDPKKKNFDNFMNLAFLFEELFHRKVEVVTSESLSPYLKPYILKEVEYVDLS